jgi:hypothetical protein
MPTLEDFGATIVIGACSIAALVLAIDWLWKTKLFSKLKGDAEKEAPLALMFLLLAVSYAVGMLIENTSDYVIGLQVDELPVPRRLMPRVPSESELKRDVLFEVDESGAKMTRLGREVYMAGLFAQFAGVELRLGGDGRTVTLAKWDAHRQLGRTNTLKSISMKVYYAAKNRVFQEGNYFGELMNIQHRIDFARSFGLGAAYVFALVLLFTVARCVHGVVNTVIGCFFQFGTGVRSHTQRENCPSEKPSHVVWRVLTFCLVAWLFYYVALSVYKYEETQFNKRVFGYFLSLDTPPDHQPSPFTPPQAEGEFLELIAHRSLEASGVATSGDHLLIVNDKDNLLYVVNTSSAAPLPSAIAVGDFPEKKAKFEEISLHPESGYFYVIGAH